MKMTRPNQNPIRRLGVSIRSDLLNIRFSLMNFDVPENGIAANS
jgi:hypothetical protein